MDQVTKYDVRDLAKRASDAEQSDVAAVLYALAGCMGLGGLIMENLMDIVVDYAELIKKCIEDAGLAPAGDKQA